jgi:hypothetical protein
MTNTAGRVGGVYGASRTALVHDRAVASDGSIAMRVGRLVPELRSDFDRLARIPSIAFHG